ncbi:P110/LppT family adhesin N-terminal domain [Mesomycoplasma hyopneumoniae]|uniref:P110/LppT family adhesin N-terminal domain n=1 Tax=Mesomycoplasma hyopneumoniae TaxID=2099 RepID=UPI0003FF38F8
MFTIFFNLQKPFWLITTIAGISLSLSAAVGIVVGINSYNKSYYSYLNQLPSQLKVTEKAKISQEKFDSIVLNLKIKDNFKKWSAKTVLTAAKSDLYRYNLVSAFDLSELINNDYLVSFDLENAVVDQNSIKNVVIYAKSDKDQITYSKQIVLKGFGNTEQARTNFDFSQIDSSKSFVDLSRANLTLMEFQILLAQNFENERGSNWFSRLERALVASKASLSLYNSLGEPVFLGPDYQLDPVLDRKKLLTLLNKDGKLVLGLNLVQISTKKTMNLNLEVRGAISNQEISKILKSWLETNLQGKLKTKDDLQMALVKDKISLSDYWYGTPNSKVNTSQILTKSKEFKDLFDLRESNFFLNTKIGTVYLSIIPKLLDPSQISVVDKKKLVENQKIRFEITASLKRKAIDKKFIIQDLPVFVDLKVDFNKYQAAVAQMFGTIKSVKEFSMPEDQDAKTLSSNEIKQRVDRLFELAKTVTNLENPSEEVLKSIYLLNTGKYLVDQDQEKVKQELKTVIEGLKSKANTQKTEKNSPTQPKKPEVSLAKTTENSAKTVKVSTFAEEAKGQSQSQQTQPVSTSSPQTSQNSVPNSTSSTNLALENEKFGTSIWTAFNFANIYNLENTKSEYEISTLGNKLFFDFKLVDKTNQNLILAQSKISLNNIINSNKSAYDIIKKFNPDVFLDGTINYQDQGKDKKEFILKDLSDNKLIFKSEDAIQTDQGLELRKPLKLSPTTNSSSTTSQKTNKKDDIGVFWLALQVNNITDFKNHHLISDGKGNGIILNKYEVKDETGYQLGLEYPGRNENNFISDIVDLVDGFIKFILGWKQDQNNSSFLDTPSLLIDFNKYKNKKNTEFIKANTKILLEVVENNDRLSVSVFSSQAGKNHKQIIENRMHRSLHYKKADKAKEGVSPIPSFTDILNELQIGATDNDPKTQKAPVTFKAFMMSNDKNLVFGSNINNQEIRQALIDAYIVDKN